MIAVAVVAIIVGFWWYRKRSAQIRLQNFYNSKPSDTESGELHHSSTDFNVPASGLVVYSEKQQESLLGLDLPVDEEAGAQSSNQMV